MKNNIKVLDEKELLQVSGGMARPIGIAPPRMFVAPRHSNFAIRPRPSNFPSRPRPSILPSRLWLGNYFVSTNGSRNSRDWNWQSTFFIR